MKRAAFLLLLCLAIPAAAQKNEVGMLIGGHFPLDFSTGLSVGSAFMLEGDYARQIAGVPALGAYLEVPVVGSFNASVVGPSFTSNGFALLRNYSSLFVVPGLKVKLAPNFPIAPYIAGGLGIAHFSGSSTLTNGLTNPSPGTNKFAYDIGGGLDFRFGHLVGARLEVRDIITSVPLLSPLGIAETALGLSTHQHNLLAGAGVTFRF